MNGPLQKPEFYKVLESSLPSSTASKRRVWAATIIDQELDIKDLSELLKSEQKIATRFLWLLSELGLLNPNRLFVELPFLFDVCEHLNPVYKTSFANFWLIAGVPVESEGKAIDLLFHYLVSNDTNVTIKSRSLLVLVNLTKKYPELKNELSLCLKDQMHKHTIVFEKRAAKVLLEIG